METFGHIPTTAAFRILLLLAAAASIGGAAAVAEERDQAIIDAVRLANSLEGQYWAHPDAFPTWESLYAHYRKGYSATLAERMTEYTLSEDGDAATWVPDRVHVAGYDGNSAVAWFRTPPELGEDGVWGMQPFMVVRLRKEGERWVIYWATDSATPPPAP